MKMLRNGDVAFYTIRKGPRPWSVALLCIGLGLLLGLILDRNTAFSKFLFVVPVTVLIPSLTGMAVIPGALVAGFFARNIAETIGCCIAAVLGVAAATMFVVAPDVVLDGVIRNLFFAVTLSHGVYAVRLFCGFRPVWKVAPYSSLECVECGYWLPGLSERRCPECGTPFGRQDA